MSSSRRPAWNSARSSSSIDPCSWMPVSNSTIPSPLFDREGVDVGHARPRQRKPQPPDAGQHPVRAPVLALAAKLAHTGALWRRSRTRIPSPRASKGYGQQNPGPADAVRDQHLHRRLARVRDRSRAGRPRAPRARVGGGAGAGRRRRHRAHPPPPRPRRLRRLRCASAREPRWPPGAARGRAKRYSRSRAPRGSRWTSCSRRASASGRWRRSRPRATPPTTFRSWPARRSSAATRCWARAASSSPRAVARWRRTCESLRRLQSLRLTALCPGHGPIVWDPQAKLSEYLDHRLDRERRLVAALARGLRSATSCSTRSGTTRRRLCARRRR